MMKDFNIIDPLVVIAICLLKNYTICALHLGTVVGLLMQSRFAKYNIKKRLILNQSLFY